MTTAPDLKDRLIPKWLSRRWMIGALLIAAFCQIQTARSAQLGNFTYTDLGSSIIITDYASNATGSVVIPATIAGKPVKSIGSSAFAYCSGITSVTIPSGIPSIPPYAFVFCGSLTSVTIPASVTTIGDHAFQGCQNLQSITFPASLSGIGVFAFNGCALKSVSLPAGTTSIGSLAFGSCKELASITVDAANPAIVSEGGVLFNKLKTTLIKCPSKKTGSYLIPSSVTRIEEQAFDQCAGLTAITIPSGVTSIGASAFIFCEGLTTITIPSGVTSLAEGTFRYCYSLKKVSIPAAVTSIGPSAFYNCKALAEVTIPAGVTIIGQQAFAACTSLTSIGVDAGNPNFSSVDGLLFDKSKSTLLQCPAGKAGELVVPAGALTIGPSAFGGCSKMTRVSIPSTVTSIQAAGFSGCIALTGITIPASIISIGDRAFEYCLTLSMATFAGDAPTMGVSPFGVIAANLTVNYYNNKTGFTSPTWQGCSSANLGDRIDLPPALRVESSGATELAAGTTAELFATVTVGAGASATLTLTNIGTDDLTGLSIKKSGNHSADFQIGPLASDYLMGGANRTVQISFTPKSAGIRTTSIEITSNDASNNPYVIHLTGTGLALPLRKLPSMFLRKLTSLVGWASEVSVALRSVGPPVSSSRSETRETPASRAFPSGNPEPIPATIS